MSSEQPWRETWRADPAARELADRHYSRKTVGAAQFSPPGRVLVLRAERAFWVTSWPRYTQHAWPGSWMCSAFRNEGSLLSSELVTAAVAATRWRWPVVPELGMVTFVDPAKVRRKRDPGRCFRRAGFVEVGRTLDRNLVVLQLLPAAAMPDPVAPANAQLSLLPEEAGSWSG